MKVIFAKPFKFSPNGYDIIEYGPGEAEVSDRCAHVAAEAKVLAEEEPEKETKTKKKA